MTKKVAVVTAAGKGMGEAVARQLASEGYDLALLSISGGAEKLAEELGGMGMTGTVAEDEVLKELVERTLDKYGRIDAVVNHTGPPPKGELLQIPDSDWLTGLDLLLLNVIRMARLVTPSMIGQGGGAFVNISAYAAVQPDLAFPVSSTLRAALSNFTKLYANRYAASDIRMNAVLPGFVDNYPESEELLSKIPAARYGSVKEIASTVSFLLSDDAKYINGQSIRVDGSMTQSV